PVNLPLYKEISARIMTILRSHADRFEGWGIDEAFLDVTLRVQTFSEAIKLAQEIKNEIYEKEKLTCSIGVGPNKLVAKIASDHKKPDGLTVIEEKNVKTFLSPLPVRKLLWVGIKTEQKLNEMGIQTIGDLANYDASILKEKLGAMGIQLGFSAQGIDRSKVQERSEIKSISRDTTFEEDTADSELIFKTLDALSEDVHKQLTESHFTFKTVTIRVRYENFETHTHSKTLPFLTNQLNDVKRTARELVKDYLHPDRKIRLIGVRLSSLSSGEKQKQLV
ncbi:MAG: DNA polymerase IV, partial [Candidatus Bathyarchaeota archaeon]